MIIYRYRPAFFDGYPDEQAEVHTFEEFMDIPWIKQWEDSPAFHQISINEDKNWRERYGMRKPMHTILCELKDGYEWWVMAVIWEEDVTMLTNNLPQWKPKYPTTRKP